MNKFACAFNMYVVYVFEFVCVCCLIGDRHGDEIGLHDFKWTLLHNNKRATTEKVW